MLNTPFKGIYRILAREGRYIIDVSEGIIKTIKYIFFKRGVQCTWNKKISIYTKGFQGVLIF